MDIEHLNKSQIILLTLLVSFVTSIATGIVTVSLMDQAPPVIAQTVNRVIERTVETVTPSPQNASPAAVSTVITQQKTVVIKESELISEAVEKINPSVVRLYTLGDAPSFLGLGVVLDSSGTIVADSSSISDSDAIIARADGTRVRALVSNRDKVTGLTLLRAATSSEDKSLVWTAALVQTGQAVLGQSVVSLSGKSISRIASGLVTAMLTSEGGAPIIDTNVDVGSILDGSPLIDTEGNLIGVSTAIARASSASGFIAASALLPAPAKK